MVIPDYIPSFIWLINSLFRAAKAKVAPLVPDAAPQPHQTTVSHFDALANKFYKKKQMSQALDDEFTAFKGLPVMEIYKDSDGIIWWKLNKDKYPILAGIARCYLAIPASSAPSERIFSKYGLVWEKKRGNLIPETANDIVYLHEARRREEEEKYAFEESE